MRLNKFKLQLLFFLMSLFLFDQSESKPTHPFTIKTNVLTTTIGFLFPPQNFTLDFNAALKSKFEIQGEIVWAMRNGLERDYQTWQYIPEGRYFLKSNKANSFFTGIYSKITSRKEKGFFSESNKIAYNVKITNLSGGLLFGYKHYLTTRFLTEIYLGGGIFKNIGYSEKVNEVGYLTRSNGPDLRIGINFGYILF